MSTEYRPANYVVFMRTSVFCGSFTTWKVVAIINTTLTEYVIQELQPGTTLKYYDNGIIDTIEKDMVHGKRIRTQYTMRRILGDMPEND